MTNIIKNIAERLFTDSKVQMGDAILLRDLTEFHINGSMYVQNETIKLYTYSYSRGLQEVVRFRPVAQYSDDRNTQWEDGHLPILEECDFILVHKKGDSWLDSYGIIETDKWDEVFIIPSEDIKQIPHELDVEEDLRNAGYSYHSENGDITITKDGISYDFTIHSNYYLLIKKRWQ